METVQQNGRFTLFCSKFPSNIYSIFSLVQLLFYFNKFSAENWFLKETHVNSWIKPRYPFPFSPSAVFLDTTSLKSSGSSRPFTLNMKGVDVYFGIAHSQWHL